MKEKFDYEGNRRFALLGKASRGDFMYPRPAWQLIVLVAMVCAFLAYGVWIIVR